jgi:hypothetical protein
LRQPRFPSSGQKGEGGRQFIQQKACLIFIFLPITGYRLIEKYWRNSKVHFGKTKNRHFKNFGIG